MSSTKEPNMKTITARARFFSNGPIESRRCRVEDGKVLVWDEVAGHYTRCHALSKRTESRIAHMASDCLLDLHAQTLALVDACGITDGTGTLYTGLVLSVLGTPEMVREIWAEATEEAG